MSEICRKDALARNLNRMLKLFPKDYNIFPKTWILPAEYVVFHSYLLNLKHIWIIFFKYSFIFTRKKLASKISQSNPLSAFSVAQQRGNWHDKTATSSARRFT